jgi:hypothetical protein
MLSAQLGDAPEASMRTARPTPRRAGPPSGSTLGASRPPAKAPVSDWLALVRAEYLEFPQLHLTEPQVRRLWSFDSATCHEVLTQLVDTKFLTQTRDGAYVRNVAGSELEWMTHDS